MPAGSLLICLVCTLGSAYGINLGVTKSLKDALPVSGQLSVLSQLLVETGLLAEAGLNGGAKIEFTLLAPTAQAWATFFTQQPALRKDAAAMTAILRQHLIPGYSIGNVAKFCYDGQVLPSLQTRANGRSQIRVRKVKNVVKFASEMTPAAGLTGDFLQAGEIKVYMIDTVLMPNLQAAPGPYRVTPQTKYTSVMNAIDNIPGLETLATAVKATGLDKVFSDPNLKGTFFAPNHKALQYIVKDYAPATVETFLANTTRLACILKAHFVPGVAATRQQLISGSFQVAGMNKKTMYRTLQGTGLFVAFYKEHVMISAPKSRAKVVRAYGQCLKGMNCVEGKDGVAIGKAPGAFIHVVDHFLIVEC